MFDDSPNLSNVLLLQRVQRIKSAVKQDSSLRRRPSCLLKAVRTSTEEIEAVLGCDYTQLLENPTIPQKEKETKKNTVHFHQKEGTTTGVSTFSNDSQGYMHVNQMPLPAPAPIAPGQYPIISPAASSGYKSEDASPIAFSSGIVPNQFVFPANNFTIQNMVKSEKEVDLLDQALADLK